MPPIFASLGAGSIRSYGLIRRLFGGGAGTGAVAGKAAADRTRVLPGVTVASAACAGDEAAEVGRGYRFIRPQGRQECRLARH